MSKNTYQISANDVLMGEYRGTNIDEALDAYASDAGYDGFSDLLANVPGSTREEVEVVEIDVDRLCEAVEAAAGQSVFQDSYGNGVALVAGESYATYRELADAHSIDISDFSAQ